jgi:hypothetical protein
VVTFDPPLPDEASAGDPGHTDDHNSIVAALTALNDGKPDSGAGAIVDEDVNDAADIAPTKIAGTALVESSVTTLGDLFVGTGEGIVGILPADANGLVLTTDDEETVGLKWEALPSSISPTVIDAKGDLLVGTAADTVGRLAAGTNGKVLGYDDQTTSGLAALDALILPVTPASITGEQGTDDSAILAALLTALDNLGLITDNTTTT